MRCADALDLSNSRQDLRWRVLVIVLCASDGARRQDTGIEDTAKHNGNTLFQRQRHELLQRGLLQERVTPGEQHHVEGPGLRKAHAHLGFIDADAYSRDHALATKLVERHIGTGHRLAKPVLDRVLAMGPDIDIVDQKQIDPAGAEPQQ